METFERTELKYILSKKQYDELKTRAGQRIVPAEYSDSRVLSIYYDTKDQRLIRRSLEKPEYKEKLRIRAYDRVGEDGKIFIELKKKVAGIVYKRRTEADYDELKEKGLQDCSYGDRQVGKEIRYFEEFYQDLEPKMWIGAHRLSYVGEEDSDLRITFDEEVTYRTEDLDFRKGSYGQPLLPEGSVLMEVKAAEAMPLWLARIFSELSIYPNSFSKYGAAYVKQTAGGQ